MKHTLIRLTAATPHFVFCLLASAASAGTNISTLPPLAPNRLILDSAKLQGYATRFNADDEKLYANVPNKDAISFLDENIPLFECPDRDFERT